MKQRKQGTAGFTLVELIVVIAILGILAGVGTVAYTGYVKRANKAVDQQLFRDVIYAMQLADYSNPGMLENSIGMAILTDSSAPIISISGTDEESAAFQSALEDAIPDLSSARLKYDWGMKPTNTQNILDSLPDTGLDQILENGNTISYAQNANEMWDAVSTLALNLEPYYHGTAGELVKTAASKTVEFWETYGENETAAGSAADMGQIWCIMTEQDYLDTFISDIFEEETAQGGLEVYAAAMLANNYAFTEYLRSYPGFVAEDAAILQQFDDEDGDFYKVIGMMSMILDDDFYDDEQLKEELGDFQTDRSVLQEAIRAYKTTPVDKEGHSQAYLDGVAYYTLMYNVDQISGTGDGQYDPTTDSYLSDLNGYVSLAGLICSGMLDTSALDDALSSIGAANNAVIITACGSGDAMTVYTAPNTAMPGSGS